MDSRATDHIIGELEKLTIYDKYSGSEHVRTANRIGMEIDHVCHSTLHSRTSNIHLNNILHVPKANKSLISVNRLACDNNAFLEFYPDHFDIKEQGTKRTLLRCEGWLYPLKPLPNKQVLNVVKPSASLWHSRIGHASTPVA